MAGTSRKNNIGLKIISVVLALLLWAYIANENQGSASQHTAGVSLRYTNLGDGLVVSGPERVAVKLWGSFRETGAVVAYVDLRGLGEGTYQLPVQVKTVKGAMFASVQPDKVEVVLKRTTRHEFKIGYRVVQSPPEGYQLLDVVFIPDRCLVTGDDASVKRVDQVISSLQLGNTRESTTSRVKLAAVDANGSIIGKGIRITPAQLEVYVAIAPRQSTKKVDVKPVLQGKLPDGYQLQDVLVTPTNVTLRGSEEALVATDEITAEVSLQDRKQSFSQEIELKKIKDAQAFPSKVIIEVLISSNSEEVTQ
ncbi:MAG: YbbR-like domain-containing protein [Deltaproteobacteria bacterium]